MFELLVRLALAAGVSGIALAMDPAQLPWAGKLSALLATVAVVAYLFERREARNAGFAGMFAALDAGLLAMALAKVGHLETFGFLVLLPLAYATLRFGANPAATAPLAGAGLVLAHMAFGVGDPSPALLGQAAAVLVLGLMLGSGRAVVTAEPALMPKTEPSPAPLTEDPAHLRDRLRDLERRCERERVVVSLHNAARAEAAPLPALASALRDALEADAVGIYCLSDGGIRLSPMAWSGEVQAALNEEALQAPRDLSDADLRERLQEAIALLAALPTGSPRVNVVLYRSGDRVTGLVATVCRSVGTLNRAGTRMEPLVPLVGDLIRQAEERRETARRLKETELLYLVASAANGAETPSNLAARVVRELWEALHLDHLGVSFLDGDRPLPVLTHGAPIRVVEMMSFARGPGVQGWLRTGTPELVVPDALDDMRLEKNEAIKKRLGCFAVMPLQFGDTPFGYVTAATHRVAGIDQGSLDTLRTVCSELTQAIARLQIGQRDPAGLATPAEFRKVLEGAPQGCLIYLEVVRRDELVDRFGKPAIEHAVRRFAVRMRAKLPVGGLMCRRAEGDYVVLLRTTDESAARSWANDAAATASMIGVTTPDGKRRIPLALRAKVAPLVESKPHETVA